MSSGSLLTVAGYFFDAWRNGNQREPKETNGMGDGHDLYLKWGDSLISTNMATSYEMGL